MYDSGNYARIETVVHYSCESPANAIVAIQTHTFNPYPTNVDNMMSS
jgi:hypothetical protein